MRNRVLVGVRSVAVATVGLLVLSGCGDGDKKADPDPTTSPSASSDSPSPSETEPSVAAATGPEMTASGVSIHAPDTFKLMDDLTRYLRTAQDPVGYSQVSLAVTPDTGIDDLDGLARVALTSGTFTKGAKQLPNETIAGVDFYRVAGKNVGGLAAEEFGTSHDGLFVHVMFTFDERLAGKRDEIVDSVLASYTWP